MEIHFEIENKCLLRCKHCSSFASSSGDIMQYSDKNMIAFLKGLSGKKKVYLTGGEPLLYPQLDGLLCKISQDVDDVAFGLFTSGIREINGKVASVSDDYAFILAENSLKECYLSIYSHCQKEHDWMTNFEGSFELTRSSASAFIHAGVEVRFNTVITAKNHKKIIEIIRMAEEWGIQEVRLLKLIRHGRAEKLWNVMGIEEEQYRETVIKALGYNGRVRITASGTRDIVPCKSDCGDDICPAGKKQWYVNYQGGIYPCACIKNDKMYQIGNIRDANILGKVEKWRQFSNQKKLC